MQTWPHAPSKVVTHPGTYIVTAGTYQKAPHFNGNERLDLLLSTILTVAQEQGWQLQAWAAFPNHYHLVGFSPNVEKAVKILTAKIHGVSARELNKLDSTQGRTVWYRSWDTRLSFEKSYLARLAYVHNNPVKHGLVQDAKSYKWCSARWFNEGADVPFRQSVLSLYTDRVNVYDDFD